MTTFLLGFVGIGGAIGLGFLFFHPAGRKLLAFMMEFTVPLLIAGLVLIAVSGFLIAKWSGADHRAKVEGKRADRAEANAAGLETKLSVCNANLDVLTVALEGQNQAIDRLKSEGEERTRRANAAVQRAQEQARGLQRKISRLENAKPSGDVCTSARSLIVETLRGER
jgi:hydroxypyruvate isomerase